MVRDRSRESPDLFLEAATKKAEDTACTLCILQRVLHLGLSVGTHALQEPREIGEATATLRPSFSSVQACPGNPRSPPTV